jgi:hypothetical protein
MTSKTWYRTTVAVWLMTLAGALPALRAQEPPPDAQASAPQPADVGLPPPAAAAAPEASASALPATPVRLSMTSGSVSFWRPGAGDWTQARINTPLAPGDALYTQPGAALELQVGPYAFLRASVETQLGLENQEPDFLQLKLTAGHLSLDARRLKAGQVIEIDVPNAACSIGTSGYYRVDVAGDTATFITRSGGRATITPATGQALGVASSEEVIVRGGDTPAVETYVAPELDAWDRWNYARTDHLTDSVSARYVGPGVYGIDELDHYGRWRVTDNYGPVWVPSSVPPGWAPYSAGRWIWDATYGWSWIDDAPWGWAPCHYGRWVQASGYWAWAPGPAVAVSVYAPALVAFFGGPSFGVSIGIGAPAVGWVALGWGEPVVPWWGPTGFVGVPSWRGWGGPRVVNNVVINRTTIINANTINVYRNAAVPHALVALPQDRFGRGTGTPIRVAQVDPHQLDPLRGKLSVPPGSASLSPSLNRAAPPPAGLANRSVVATRAPRDVAAPLRAAGLKPAEQAGSTPHVVSAPSGPHPSYAAARPPFGQQGNLERQPPPPPRLPAHQPGLRGSGVGRAASAPQVPSGSSLSRVPGRQRPPSNAFSGVTPSQAAPPNPRAAPPRPVSPPRLAAPREMPGQPANRLYQPSSEMRSTAPAAPQHAVGPAPGHAHGGVPQHSTRQAQQPASRGHARPTS